jgi:squalene/oxidosqualene cyclase-like protein
MLAQGPGRNSATTDQEELRRALERGYDRLVTLQIDDGSWLGDYGGPMFLLPMYVAACRLCEHDIPEGRRAGMVRYLKNMQRPDGGIGLHAEGKSCIFTSALGYVALRLLGIAPEDPAASRLRVWVRAHGGPLGAASWGKLVLALLGLYEYEGLHPILPELWLLPEAVPVHPSRLWCHVRQVYLPMAWLYGQRARGPEDELIRALREELYPVAYASVPWRQHRDTVAETDLYKQISPLLRGVNWVMGFYEDHHRTMWRIRALAELLDHIQYEDRVTSFIRLGPVNAVLNTLVHHFRGREGRYELERSLSTLDGYLWDAYDGTKMNGYNSCALWDTVLAVQAILASPLIESHTLRSALARAHIYLRENQILEDPPEHHLYYRNPSRGGWPFSNRAHGWPITDCTAEGLKCALALEAKAPQTIPESLLIEAAQLILSFQNRDGGWATYELQRGGAWLEQLNPSQIFGDIMVDYSYVECTSACMQALVRAQHRFPGILEPEVAAALRRGEHFLRSRQRADGSWEGSWAVCFTYGTWFGVAGLLAAGASPTDPALERACDFLVGKQGQDGGWGEDGESCAAQRYIPLAQAHAVNTAWALHSLVRAGRAGSPAAVRAASCLMAMQEQDGDWPRQSLCGVFNKTTLINYENYRRYFPLWALSDYGRARNWF